MSYNPIQEQLDTVTELNAAIVKRQKAAIDFLERILVDQLDMDMEPEAVDTQHVINLLKDTNPPL